MKFPINRTCPLTGMAAQRVLAYIPAAVVAAGNPTYRSSFAEILDIAPNDEFPIVESAAGFVFSGYLPPPDFLHRLYEQVVDSSKTMTAKVFYGAVLEFASAFYVMAQGRDPSPWSDRRLLDYGCGYGLLLHVLSGSGVRAIGYEPSGSRRTPASLGGLEIFDNLDQVAAAGPFDLLICTEVLEHLPEPRAALRFMREHAAPGALLCISVPLCERPFVDNCLNVLSERGQLPLVFNPWEHLNYFSAASLRQLLSEEGFKVIYDYGRTSTARVACALFGEAKVNSIVNSLRIFKRAATATPSTQLFCVIS